VSANDHFKNCSCLSWIRRSSGCPLKIWNFVDQFRRDDGVRDRGRRKLLLTVFANSVLLVKMELIGYAARLAAETTLPRADLRAAGVQLVVHAAGGLLMLLVPAVLSVQAAGHDPVRVAKAE
jgi:hypothetical protein